MRISTVRGKGLETAILASQTATVALTKVPHGVKWIRGGQRVPVRGPVDFVGVGPGGRMIALDAKECDQLRRFPVGNRSHVPVHQVHELVRFGQRGALAGLLIEGGGIEEATWDRIELILAAARRSLAVDA